MNRGKHEPYGPLNTYVMSYTMILPSDGVMYERITHYTNGTTGEIPLFRIEDGDYYPAYNTSEHLFSSDVWHANLYDNVSCFVPDVDEIIFLAKL